MSIEDTIRAIVREELQRHEDRLVHRLLEQRPAAGDQLLRPTQAAKLTGYSADTILRWAREGRLTRHGTIRAVRVSEAELRALVAPKSETRQGPPNNAQILDLAKRRADR